MNLHKNARTCPKSRAAMVHRVLEERVPVSVVAEQYGMSRKTVYKWIRRYCAGGDSGLRDGSSEPRQIPHRLGQDWVDLIVEMRRSYGMTALRIANQLRLSRSSVAAVLQREGLSQLKKLEPPEPVIRYEHDGPGEMLHLDIKKLGRFWRAGHRVTGNRRQLSRPTSCRLADERSSRQNQGPQPQHPHDATQNRADQRRDNDPHPPAARDGGHEEPVSE